MTTQDKIYAGVIVASIMLISYLHYSASPGSRVFHGIYKEVYFIPVLLGALRFGLKGALGTFILVVFLYRPFLFSTWAGLLHSEQLMSLLFTGLFAVLAGLFVDRDKKYREQLAKDRYLAGLGQAATTIVHDLKNPIVTIQGFARRIKEKKGDSSSAAESIIEAAQDMQDIVCDVLDFAKPIQLELKEQDIGRIIKRSYEACKFRADEVGCLLTLDIPVQPVMVVVDAPRLERAIANMLTNAIEASGKGQGSHISMVDAKERVSITIQDSGIGMDKETIKHIFIPFYTKKSTGTGLGMPIARKIIEGHKGNISIQSTPGKGTIVKIHLPKISADTE